MKKVGKMIAIALGVICSVGVLVVPTAVNAAELDRPTATGVRFDANADGRVSVLDLIRAWKEYSYTRAENPEQAPAGFVYCTTDMLTSGKDTVQLSDIKNLRSKFIFNPTIASVQDMITALPEAEELVSGNRVAVCEAKAAYDALSDGDKAGMVNAGKLNACVAKVKVWDNLAAKIVVDMSYQTLGVDGTIALNVDDNTFGKVMTVKDATYIAVTPAVMEENSAYKECKNIAFFIYNPTDSVIDGNYTIDWGYYGYFQLQPKSWNRIEIADFGAAANKQIISNGGTVYFYAAMAGEGWKVSSFYNMSDGVVDVEGETVVIDASYQTLGCDGTFTTNVDDADFGKVMSVSGATYVAVTPNVMEENPAYKQSKAIAFYIYNPTDSDVDGNYTIDWGYYGYFQLKAKSWNRIEIADIGAAANKQFISNGGTVYFYAAFTGEGWKVSNFYSLGIPGADIVEEETGSEVDAIAAVSAQIMDLPEASALQLSDKETVRAAEAGYEALSEGAKSQVTNVEKLNACIEKVNKWDTLAEKTVVDASYQILGVDGTISSNVDDNTFGKVMSVANSTYVAVTPSVMEENPAYKTSKSIAFFIYNPTNTDIDGNYTIDWGYYGYFQLKAKSWNRIEIADIGAAANKQFISNGGTVYFYAAFTGEGWKVSSFYSLSNGVVDVEGDTIVVDASYQTLGVDGTITVGVDDADFGKVMSVANSTYVAVTPNVMEENPAYKQSKAIAFYIYNPTNSDVDGYYTIDWQYNGYFQLKAKSWNRIEIADIGAAANKQFISNGGTVYFYAAFSGEGWKISNFYSLSE